MHILGISAFYHDSAAALLTDGKIIAAAQEERFSRKKHDSRFPRHALSYCLQEAAINARELDWVVFYDKPLLKFERLLETYLAVAPRGFRSFSMAIPLWIKEKLFQRNLLIKSLRELSDDIDWEKRLLFSEHHIAHAASAFFPSPFREAAVLTMDGVGEWATTSLSIGRENRLEMLKEIHFPHSLGLLYSAFTYYTGFKVNSGEYKLMGLAPYGEPRFKKLILDNLIDLKPDGSFRLNLDYFDYCAGLRMTNERFEKLFGLPVREPEQLLTQDHMDLAASVQAVIEEAVLKLTRAVASETKLKNLCLAGGVALNCVANGKVLADGKFEKIWIQPASGDAGGALGAALAAYHLFQNQPRIFPDVMQPKLVAASRKSAVPIDLTHLDAMNGSFLGPGFSQTEIESRLTKSGAKFVVLNDTDLIEKTAQALVDGKAIGWFQGRMEFGPRALGARSILGDARSPAMQKTLNLRVKYRESFRPFAPSVLREDVGEWFDLNEDSPYMLLVAHVAKNKQRTMTQAEEALFGIEKLNSVRSEIPAVTHVDYSARIQTVHRETNPRYHALISAFKAKTGCPVIVNTSFNVRGEPIVCTPKDAFRCFMGSDIEVLVIENCYLKKEEQDASLKSSAREEFEMD